LKVCDWGVGRGGKGGGDKTAGGAVVQNCADFGGKMGVHETGGQAREAKSRLKGGCSQDWPPHSCAELCRFGRKRGRPGCLPIGGVRFAGSRSLDGRGFGS